MKAKKLIMSFLLVFTLGLFLTGCAGESKTITYNVTYELDGGQWPSDSGLTNKVELKINSIVEEPQKNPEKKVGSETFTFTGWYIVKNSKEEVKEENKFDFNISYKIKNDIILKAGWTK